VDPEFRPLVFGLDQAVDAFVEPIDLTARYVARIGRGDLPPPLEAPYQKEFEAARAGDAGRGFAVVAEEVRSLALRSKAAAQRTELLVRESIQQAAGGGAIAVEVAGMLERIRTQVNGATEAIGTLAEASRSQTARFGSIEAAVSAVDRAMQQTAASAEESSSAALELTGQAEELGTMASAFRLEPAGTGRTAPAIARRPPAALRSASPAA
jgi:methyl-accepting chemotaxis protein